MVALGGSVVFPDGIDWRFLRRFKKFLKPWLAKKKFVLVVGGGRLARVFQEAASRVAPVPDEDRDWIGIHSTRLNAQLLRTIFREVADPVVNDSRHKTKRLRYPVTIASGWRPGWSTDFVAAAIAKDLGVPEFVVAGKPAFVYHKDPASHKDARPFMAIGWKEYRKLIPRKWVPGSHAPVDPVAAKLSDGAGVRSIVVNGRDLENFSNLLSGRDFRGTIIG